MWRFVGVFQVTKDWVYSSPVQGEIFRVKSFYIGNFSNQYLKGVVASIFIDDDSTVNLVESRKLTYRSEPEIFTFYFPNGLGDQRIGVKRLDSTAGLEWWIEIEIFQSNNPIQDLEDYLKNKFGKSLEDLLMAVYTRNSVTDLDPNSGRVNLKAGVPLKIIDKQPRRRSLTIYATNVAILVCGAVDDKGAPSKVLQTVLPNEIFEVPTVGNGSIYMGEVFLLANADTSASFLEFNSPQ